MSIEDRIARQREKCARLRQEMHEAPMNKVFTTHEGHKHLGTHSMAWADRSREWCEAVADLERMEEVLC